MDRGHLRIDKERYTCTWMGNKILLTLTEFRLLEALVVRLGVALLEGFPDIGISARA
jgi:two-component system response regulator ChvI